MTSMSIFDSYQFQERDNIKYIIFLGRKKTKYFTNYRIDYQMGRLNAYFFFIKHDTIITLNCCFQSVKHYYAYANYELSKGQNV